jgi:hypothetical protein
MSPAAFIAQSKTPEIDISFLDFYSSIVRRAEKVIVRCLSCLNVKVASKAAATSISLIAPMTWIVDEGLKGEGAGSVFVTELHRRKH